MLKIEAEQDGKRDVVDLSARLSYMVAWIIYLSHSSKF